MGRRIDEQLWEGWRRRLARYEEWSGTVAAFCDRENVSVVAFYQWRRKLDGQVAGGPAKPLAKNLSAAEAAPRFLPVRIASAPEPVEIELPNGVRVRVAVDSAWTLDAILAAAARCEAISGRTEVYGYVGEAF